MATLDEIYRFKRAMEVAYGPIGFLSEVEAQMWIPANDPGAGGHKGRYLWTDAFGVINFITLAKETVSPVYLVLAKRLVSAVHDELGWRRDGSARLSPATEEEPLKGGLRMGETEEGNDGQFHYSLILWTFVLNRLSLATGEIKYNRLAVQLAKAVFASFIKWDKTLTDDGGGLRLAWKVSVEGRKILIPEEGNFDAEAGYTVLCLVQQAAEELDGAWGILSREIASYHLIMGRAGRPVLFCGLFDFGMGLWVMQFFRSENWARELANEYVVLASRDLICYPRTDTARRVAFRELSTCLGLKCHGVGMDMTMQMQAIMLFWPGHYESCVPDSLRPMTLVMYAAALVPGAFRDGYLWIWKP